MYEELKKFMEKLIRGTPVPSVRIKNQIPDDVLHGFLSIGLIPLPNVIGYLQTAVTYGLRNIMDAVLYTTEMSRQLINEVDLDNVPNEYIKKTLIELKELIEKHA